MIEIDIRNPAFSEPMTLQCKLSILLRMDSFVFMVTDDARTLQVLREYALPAPTMLHPGPVRERLEEIIHEDPLLPSAYQQVSIAAVSPLCTLIPDALFAREHERAYLEQLTPLADGMGVRSAFHAEHQLWNVYAYPDILMAYLEDCFPDAAVGHHLSAQVESMQPYLQRTDQPHLLFMHLWKDYVQPVVFREGQLVFANMFPYRHPQDVLYYLLLACRQVEREPEELAVRLAGAIGEDSALFIELCRLAPTLERLPLMVGVPEEAQPNDRPLEAYQDLFALEVASTLV